MSRRQIPKLKAKSRFLSQLEELHRCCLIIIYDHGIGEQDRFSNGSGFIVTIGKHLVYITAGHVIDGIDDFTELGSKPQEVFFRCPKGPDRQYRFRYRDYCGLSMKNLVDLIRAQDPEMYERNRIAYEVLRSTDIGFLILPNDMRQMLDESGIRPLSYSSIEWMTPLQASTIRPASHHHLLTAGSPGSSRRPNPSWENPMSTFKSLHVLPHPTYGHDQMRTFFIPDWKPEHHSGSMVGMSGSPIAFLGLKRPYIGWILSKEFSSKDSTDDKEDGALPDYLVGFDLSKISSLLLQVIPLLEAGHQKGLSESKVLQTPADASN